METKNLVKKFSYRELVKESEKQGWTIPTLEELKHSNKLEHKEVWVADMPIYKEDRETHAMMYDADADKLFLANKSFQYNVMVLYHKHTCPHCGGKL